MELEISITFSEDQAHLVPGGLNAATPRFPDAAAVQVGDTVTIGPSWWTVAARVWVHRSPVQTTLQVWLRHQPEPPLAARGNPGLTLLH